MFERTPAPRKGMPDPHIDEAEFKKRFRSQFSDPAFDKLSIELDRVASAAGDGIDNGRKAPRTQRRDRASRTPPGASNRPAKNSIGD